MLLSSNVTLTLEGSIDCRTPSPSEEERPDFAELVAQPPRDPPPPHVLRKPPPLELHMHGFVSNVFNDPICK